MLERRLERGTAADSGQVPIDARPLARIGSARLDHHGPGPTPAAVRGPRRGAIDLRAAIRTPLIRLELPDVKSARSLELYLKLELLQPIGSFKIRGAYNVVRQLVAGELRDGVWTVSAGNAAQGVAFAARKSARRAP